MFLILQLNSGSGEAAFREYFHNAQPWKGGGDPAEGGSCQTGEEAQMPYV